MDGKVSIQDLKTPMTSFRKDSRLKRASTFFKNLSHGGSSQKQKTKSNGISLLEGSGSRLTRGFTSLLDRKRRRHSQNPEIFCDKEVIDPAQIIRSEEDFVQSLYKLDNLEAEDLQQLLDCFGEGMRNYGKAPCVHLMLISN